MRGLRRGLDALRLRPGRGLGLRPVEELDRETRSLPDAERLFAEVDEEYRRMDADHAAGLASD